MQKKTYNRLVNVMLLFGVVCALGTIFTVTATLLHLYSYDYVLVAEPNLFIRSLEVSVLVLSFISLSVLLLYLINKLVKGECFG